MLHITCSHTDRHLRLPRERESDPFNPVMDLLSEDTTNDRREGRPATSGVANC